MPSVAKKGQWWYAVTSHMVDGKQKRHWIKLPGATTRREARAQANDLTREPLSCDAPHASSLAVAAADVIENESHQHSQDWTTRCEIWSEYALDILGNRPVGSITRQDCQHYIRTRLDDGAAPSTVRKESSFLRRVLRLHGSTVFDGVRLPQEPTHAPRFLTRAQVNALLAAAPPLRAFRYRLLVFTGARKGEAQRLLWRDVGTGTVRIPNSAKGTGPRYPYRTVPIGGELAEELDKRRGEPETPVLPPMKHNWRRDFLHDCETAGIGKWRIHDLRHTYCSWLAQAGVSLHRIRDLAGHQSVTTTERYAHLLPQTDETIRNALFSVEETVEESEKKTG